MRMPEPANHSESVSDRDFHRAQRPAAMAQAASGGWGEPTVDYFDAAKITWSTELWRAQQRTLSSQGHWDRVLAMLKQGDFVMMQFGHNDEGAVNDNFRAAAH